MKDIPKQYFIFGGVIVLLVVVIIGLLVTKSKPDASKTPTPTKKAVVAEEEKPIPTVDSSVVVNIKAANGKREVLLSIEGIPADTSSVDYELSYDTAAQGYQGVVGTLPIDAKETSVQKQLVLGTCSSGHCVYHDVTGKIKVTLKFAGDYGEKLYDKELDF